MKKRRRTWSWLGGVNPYDKPAQDDLTEDGLSGERKNPLDAAGQSAYEPKSTMVPVEADPQNTIFELPDNALLGELPAGKKVTISDTIQEISPPEPAESSPRPVSPPSPPSSPLIEGPHADSVHSGVSPQ